MTRPEPTYPFVPKSNRSLREGQFWGIPLPNGRWACGRVLAVHPKLTRWFYVGLMKWSGARPPTSASIAGRPILAHGNTHLMSILHHGGQVLGRRSLDEDGLEVPLSCEPTVWGPGQNRLYRGYDDVGPCGLEKYYQVKNRSTWGRDSIFLIAERVFVHKKRLAADEKRTFDDMLRAMGK